MDFFEKRIKKNIGRLKPLFRLRYCNNKSQPSLPTLKKTADILNVGIRELLEPTKNK